MVELILLGLIAALVLLARRLRPAAGAWHEHYSLTAPDIGPVMRRKVGGRFEYRPMTPEEMNAYLDRDAW